MSNKSSSKVWYKEGLRFKCTECGQCCTGAPGYVWLTEKDIESIVKHLNISKEDFIRKYTRSVSGKLSLLEDPKSYDCIFLQNQKCSIYKNRPMQCRKFPFWKSILESKRAWNQAAKSCEGVNHPDAPVLSLKEIEKRFR